MLVWYLPEIFAWYTKISNKYYLCEVKILIKRSQEYISQVLASTKLSIFLSSHFSLDGVKTDGGKRHPWLRARLVLLPRFYKISAT